jgi:hypothetical protein
MSAELERINTEQDRVKPRRIPLIINKIHRMNLLSLTRPCLKFNEKQPVMPHPPANFDGNSLSPWIQGCLAMPGSASPD